MMRLKRVLPENNVSRRGEKKRSEVLKMKRKISLLLCLAMMLSMLAGCNAVPDAMEAIDDIGEITPDSGDVLADVEALLEEMPDRQLKKVENLEEYEEAQEQYDELTELLEDTQKAINAIGEVTPDSGSRIRKARKLYDNLEKADWEKYVADAYPVLTAAEETFAGYEALMQEARSAIEAVGEVKLNSEAKLQTAREAWEKVEEAGIVEYFADETAALEEKENTFRELEQLHLQELVVNNMEKGDVDGAKENLVQLNQKYPQCEALNELIPLVAEELLKNAQTALNDNQLLAAKTLLRDLQLALPGYARTSETYKSLQGTLSAKLEANRPANGKILHDDVGGGYGTMEVTGGSRDSVVKLEDVNEKGNYKLVYVRAGETATFNVCSGTYNVSYATGDQWYSVDDLFGEYTMFLTVRNGVEFTIEYSGNYVTYTVYTVRL